MTFYTAAITLILVMDPLGNIPIFNSILKSVDPKRRNFIILRESLVAFIIIISFLFGGKYILNGLHITIPALNIAGGIILFLIAIKMIFPPAEGSSMHVGEPFIVPLAVPLIAGPSALATVMLLSTRAPDKMTIWFLAVVIAAIIFTIIMLSSRYLLRLLGERGVIAMEHLMGMLLTTIAVQMSLEGLAAYFGK